MRLASPVRVPALGFRMTSTPGWTRDTSEILRIRLLEWAYERTGGRADDVGGLSDFLAGDDADPSWIEIAVDHLEDSDLIQVQRDFGGIDRTSVSLTPAGVAQVRALRAGRTDVAARRRAVREALLSWLYDETMPGGSTADLHLFLGEVRSLYPGERVRFAEVSQAAQYLQDQDLCVCVDTAETGPLEAAISTEGQARIEDHGGNTSPLPSAAGSSYDQRVFVNEAQNVAAHSQHVTQHAVAPVDIDALLAAARATEQALPVLELSDTEHKELERLTAEVERLAAEPQPDHGRLRLLAQTARAMLLAAAGGAGGALGSGLAGMWPG
jgi:hypothetical protein